MVPLEPFEKVFINAATYAEIDPNHAAVGCVTCHGGTEPVVAASEARDDLWVAMAKAHEFEAEYDDQGVLIRRKPEVKGVLRDPSSQAESNCNGAGCHAQIVALNATSMHTQLWGEKHKIALRAGYESYEECPQLLKDGYEGECTNCHTTCGQCHVSRPNGVHGGFLDSHKFQRTPDMENNCTACHGSRVGNDFSGHHEGNRPDVHQEQGYDCFFCHQEDLHGDGRTDYTSRYAVEGLPQCVNCHELSASDNLFHEYHWPDGNSLEEGLSCHVCHSQPYTNCLNCHSGGVWSSSDPEGYSEYVDFRIGRNTGEWPNHPVAKEEWVTVRHIPVIKDGFREWGWWSQPNWSDFETWEYASPHNIQRFTPQTEIALTNPAYSMGDCWMSCHVQGPHEEENARRFLWMSRLDSLKSSVTGLSDPDEYIRANRRVAVDDSISQYWNRH
ncbi:MAG: hypothetical protein WC326_05335 [Candidatus Delongbacteria bacterium]